VKGWAQGRESDIPGVRTPTVGPCTSTVLSCTSTVLTCTSTVPHCTSTVLHCPFTVLPCAPLYSHCTSTVPHCTSTVLHCPFTVLPCTPSTPTVLRCASTVLPCTSTILREYGSLAFFPWLDLNIIEKIDLIYISKKVAECKIYNEWTDTTYIHIYVYLLFRCDQSYKSS
jgi:hypothetical protein